MEDDPASKEVLKTMYENFIEIANKTVNSAQFSFQGTSIDGGVQYYTYDLKLKLIYYSSKVPNLPLG